MYTRFKKSIFKSALLLLSVFYSFFTIAVPNFIPIDQVTEDITYLANDNLKGRGNFSPELSKAANYIAARFKENGLKSADNLSTSDYLQKYRVTKTLSKELTVAINGENILAENLSIASDAKEISWQRANGIDSGDFSLHTINEKDNFREFVGYINQQGGQHLVLINPAHKAIFQRYQHYFEKGVSKPATNANKKQMSNTIVFAVFDQSVKDIINIKVSALNTVVTNELSNVVAMLPGKTKPDEIVLFSAHYDHLGMKNADGDNIYNGADDDASGVTAIINIAQYYANKDNNERTIIFAAFSAEEIGGFGSNYFSKQLNPNSITAMINIEMIGKPSKFGAGTLWMTGMERSDLGEKLNQALAKYNKEIHQDPYPKQNLFYRSDNATLARLGVPAHSFSSTQLDKDEHYHQVSDDLSSLDLSSLHQVIEALAIATEPLVNGKVTPSRIDVNKVKNKGRIF